MASAKSVGENLFRLPCGGNSLFLKSSMKSVLVTRVVMGKLSCQKLILGVSVWWSGIVANAKVCVRAGDKHLRYLPRDKRTK
jgi:hypothetical protein